ncbi:RluA family pseudouridine synthase [Candidatus Falkowbacteria bacterium]|nr:RluA family pseudouridine synthase [Candidatus Falkowbacteria bacterium]
MKKKENGSSIKKINPAPSLQGIKPCGERFILTIHPRAKSAEYSGRCWIKVNLENRGQRLDKFLADKLPNLSRSQIKKLIKNEVILVNNKKSSVHQFLKKEDEIKITNYKLQITNQKKSRKIAEFIPKPPHFARGKLREGSANTAPCLRRQARNDNSLTPKIIAEENDFLIIEKPAGLLVHPTEKNETDTLVDWLIDQFPKLKKIGENPERPALIHRLDKDVSGLMIIPKTQEAFDYFKQQFKEHNIIKKYIGLVYGEIKKDEAEINFAIGRSGNKKGLFAARPKSKKEQLDDKAKKAITNFMVLKKFKNYTLLEIQILTGRTHQIRVHLLAYGHPIVGDRLYFLKKLKPKINLERIFLHACHLSFIGPDNRPYEFDSKLPDDLELILTALK